jgi:hypothetical protein
MGAEHQGADLDQGQVGAHHPSAQG